MHSDQCGCYSRIGNTPAVYRQRGSNMPKTIEVTELILRDAHQSLMATRMAMEDMVPVCEDIDKAGYWSVECWGGATFDACIRFLNEDPWERLRTFRKLLPNSRLQMLLRGQNLLGYRHYEDSVVDRFVEKAAENGMDVFRVFDALNDVRNVRRPIAAVKRAGKHAQGTICYTISPLHTVTGFVEMAEQLVEMGCDSLCIKDMAALLKPQPAYDIVKAIKESVGDEIPVHVHTHATTGVTLVSLMKAIEAGADIVDTAVSSMSLGPGHNPTESLVEMLEGTGYTTRVDLSRVEKVADHFRKIRPRYREFLSNFTDVDTGIFKSQIPGGMISNMESQLKQQGAGDKIREVLEEVPNVRRDAGYPPLVTPSSQIVGTQAVFNVMMGRYKVLTGEFADLMLGYYGSTLGPRDPKVIEMAQKHAKKPPINVRPADLLKPEWDELRSKALETPGCNGSDEDVLTYAMFPQVAPKFFGTRNEGPKNVGKDPAAAAPAEAAKSEAADPGSGPVRSTITYEVKLNGKSHKVTVSPA
jgi:methylmalonyl-CoA carboxyltransferase 5S subunit